MTIEEIQARHDNNRSDISKGFYINDTAHFDREWLLIEYARLTHELAEERAACQIAGHAMDAMRARIVRQDEEIERLQEAIKLWEISV